MCPPDTDRCALTCTLDVGWSAGGILTGTMTCRGVTHTFTGVMELVTTLERLLEAPARLAELEQAVADHLLD